VVPVAAVVGTVAVVLLPQVLVLFALRSTCRILILPASLSRSLCSMASSSLTLVWRVHMVNKV